MDKGFCFVFVVVVGIFVCMMLITCSWDDYKNESSKRECESAECTDSLCMRWDDSLKRCGTDSALAKEQRYRDSVGQEALSQLDSLDMLYLTDCNLLSKTYWLLGYSEKGLILATSVQSKDSIACMPLKLCRKSRVK